MVMVEFGTQESSFSSHLRSPMTSSKAETDYKLIIIAGQLMMLQGLAAALTELLNKLMTIKIECALLLQAQQQELVVE